MAISQWLLTMFSVQTIDEHDDVRRRMARRHLPVIARSRSDSRSFLPLQITVFAIFCLCNVNLISVYGVPTKKFYGSTAMYRHIGCFDTDLGPNLGPDLFGVIPGTLGTLGTV